MRSREGGNSDEFIREVDEAVRQDRWLAIWKQYHALIVGTALLVIVGVGAGIAWKSYEDSQRIANARDLSAATALLESGRPDDAATAFRALAERAGGGVAMIARLRAAEAEKQAGNDDAELALLQSLSDDNEVGVLYQRLAGLINGQNVLDVGDADTMISQLESAATPDNPWRASLVELKAIVEMKAGRTEEARATLEALLSNDSTPTSLQRRAGELLNALGGPLNADHQAVSQNDAGNGGSAAGITADDEVAE